MFWNRSMLNRELSNDLRFILVKNLEVTLVEISNASSLRIPYDNVDWDELHIDLESGNRITRRYRPNCDALAGCGFRGIR